MGSGKSTSSASSSLLAVLVISLAASNSAFSSISHPTGRAAARLTSTRRYVLHNNWQLPFLDSSKNEADETPTRMRDASNTDFEQPKPKNSHGFLSSVFPQDTVDEASESMGDLTNFLNPKRIKESPTRNSSTSTAMGGDNLLPLLGVAAVAAVAAGVSTGNM